MHHDAFVADVRDHPDDDLRRLVFADWLEDNGDGDRAEFVRAQIEQARLDEGDPRRPALARHAAQIGSRRRQEWLGAAAHLVVGHAFHRGFLEEAWVSASNFLKHAAALFAACPLLRRVHFSDAATRIDDLASCAYLSRLELIGLHRQSLNAEHARRLADCRHLGRLRELDLSGNVMVGRHGVASLAGSPRLTRVEGLNLSRCGVGSSGVEFLALSRMSRLRKLVLSNNGVGGIGLTYLCDSTLTDELHDLDLGGNNLCLHGPFGIEAMAKRPKPWPLRLLDLSENNLRDEGVFVLAKAPCLETVRTLRLAGNSLHDGSVAELRAASELSEVRELDLSNNCLGDAAARGLSDFPSMGRLRCLNLERNVIDDAGALALSLSPYLGEVRWLNVSRNRLGTPGILALIDSANLGALRELHANNAHLGEGDPAAIANCPGLRRLTRLSLLGNRVTDAGTLALARSPHLPADLELHLSLPAERGVGVEALRKRLGNRLKE